MISSQEAYLLRPISCVEHVVASQKQIADFKGPSLLRKLEKIRKWKTKTKTNISKTVTYILISKTDSSESRTELSCMAELTRVQADCTSVTWRAFSIPGSFVGKQGDLRAEREIGEATHADFFCAIHFFWFILSCFLQFLSFFSKIKSCPNDFIRMQRKSFLQLAIRASWS